VDARIILEDVGESLLQIGRLNNDGVCFIFSARIFRFLQSSDEGVLGGLLVLSSFGNTLRLLI
jgi:hypothetical protein